MKRLDGIGLNDVRAVYSGPEGDLWELIMGEQIHMGGFASSAALVEKAGIAAGTKGVDLCCCNGGGMRFLVQCRQVAAMHGVDATSSVIKSGMQRCRQLGLDSRISFTEADACCTGLPACSFDFAWGEDAWCYVENKSKLVEEAGRLVKKDGTIAFTDWIEGSVSMNSDEARRYLSFMKFPSILSLQDYVSLLESNKCAVLSAEDTGLFAPCVDLYIDMLNKQLTYDALRIIGFDMGMLQALGKEMAFMQQLAHEGKIAQGRFVARKK